MVSFVKEVVVGELACRGDVLERAVQLACLFAGDGVYLLSDLQVTLSRYESACGHQTHAGVQVEHHQQVVTVSQVGLDVSFGFVELSLDDGPFALTKLVLVSVHLSVYGDGVIVFAFAIQIHVPVKRSWVVVSTCLYEQLFGTFG